MQIGISTYTYTWAFGVPGDAPEKPMNVYDLIDKAVALEVDCIQVADNYPLIDLPPEELGQIRKHALQHRIGIEVGGRGLTEELLDRYIALAAYFSSPILRMVIDLQPYRPDVNTVVSVIRNALPELAKQGIILALENHDRLPSSVFRDIITRIGSDYAGICLDCVNSMGIGEGIETVLDNLAPHTVNLHIKDFSVRRVSHMMGFVIEGTPAGKGFLQLPAVLHKLRPFGKCHSAILELWTPPAIYLSETINREETWAQESIAYIKPIIQQP
jgi:sugar phosphate isomerase/epimerase